MITPGSYIFSTEKEKDFLIQIVTRLSPPLPHSLKTSGLKRKLCHTDSRF